MEEELQLREQTWVLLQNEEVKRSSAAAVAQQRSNRKHKRLRKKGFVISGERSWLLLQQAR